MTAIGMVLGGSNDSEGNNGKRDTGSDKGGSEGGDNGSRSSKNKESSCAMWGEVILIQSVRLGIVNWEVLIIL